MTKVKTSHLRVLIPDRSEWEREQSFFSPSPPPEMWDPLDRHDAQSQYKAIWERFNHNREALLSHIQNEEKKLISLAKLDYNNWKRSGVVLYTIRPAFFNQLHSCQVAIFEGEVIEKKVDSVFRDAFLKT